MAARPYMAESVRWGREVEQYQALLADTAEPSPCYAPPILEAGSAELSLDCTLEPPLPCANGKSTENGPAVKQTCDLRRRSLVLKAGKRQSPHQLMIVALLLKRLPFQMTKPV